MKDKPSTHLFRFWPLLGISILGALLLSFLYALIGPGLSWTALSNALCFSSMLLGVMTALPVIFDVGRGIGITRHLVVEAERRKAMENERRRREKGITFTFALAAAALILVALSFVMLSF